MPLYHYTCVTTVYIHAYLRMNQPFIQHGRCPARYKLRGNQPQAQLCARCLSRFKGGGGGGGVMPCGAVSCALNKFQPSPIVQDEELRRKHIPLNTLTSITNSSVAMRKPKYSSSISTATVGNDNGFPKPRRILFPSERIESLMVWTRAGRAGAGLANFGNTCFLNSVLQALTHTPPLANYLLSGEHAKQCRDKQHSCAMCELEQHVQAALNSARPLRPVRIVSKLKFWAKHFRKGRQEDAHEFLRYFVDAMQRACLAGMDKNIDHASKATTFVHQTFGGFLRSQVKCTKCGYESNTYDAALDLSLDIKHARTLERALADFTKPEVLDKANMYVCAKCKEKVIAHKRFTIHTAPAILTVHLKRFDFTYRHGQKITRHVEFDEHLDISQHMSDPDPSAKYRLFAALVHAGHTTHSGHYYCYVRSPSSTWWCCDDDSVTTAGLHNVLREQAYLLFYHKIPSRTPLPKVVQAPVVASPAVGAEYVSEKEEEENIVHLDATENTLRRLVKCVSPRDTFWEVLEFTDTDCKSRKRPWTAYRVEIEAKKHKKESDDRDYDMDDDNKRPHHQPMVYTSIKSHPEAKVQSWDATLRQDDLAKRIERTGNGDVPEQYAKSSKQLKAVWDGRKEEKEDVIGILRNNKFTGFGGQVSTWDGDETSLVDSAKMSEPSLFNYTYTKDDAAIDVGRTKKVKKHKANINSTGPKINPFQLKHEHKIAQKKQSGATELVFDADHDWD